ncbi:unnamed protein product [Orchesella dallaii]|uniref:Aldehyde oxidase/xanthine dehydrogenase second molybdopterin binding domain-containing protein n=1 Tax=Orchesella dallaii TaxID=48710 RepID=A0ABP1PYN7_9HEXA
MLEKVLTPEIDIGQVEGALIMGIATAELPLCSSVCVLFALKNAIFAARKKAGNSEWFRLVQFVNCPPGQQTQDESKQIERVDIIEDAGKCLNLEIDIGQVEGALIMGIGFWTTEKLVYSNGSPGLLTYNTWQYKPPIPKDIPEDIRITLLKDAPNPYGILRSKATAEPPLCSSVCVLFALKNAIFAARKEAGNSEWFRLDGLVTPEDILLKCLTFPLLFNL